MCHSRTKNLKEVVREADIIIAALGQAEFVTADMVKDGAVIVDVGITRVKATRPNRAGNCSAMSNSMKSRPSAATSPRYRAASVR